MGIRESLLNTITSVGSSDFVRIVTSAGASSKATVANLFKSFESGLGAKSSLTTSDYIRVVGSDNNAYKQLVSDVAKKIIENYTGSSLAGSSQSVKSALDALNSKLTALGAIAGGSTKSLTVASGSRALVALLGADDSAMGIFTVSSTSGGVITRLGLGELSHITDSTERNTLILENTGSATMSVYAIVFAGSVTQQ